MLYILHQYVSLRVLVFFTLEAVLIAASLVLGAKLRFWSDPDDFYLYTAFPTFGFQMITLTLICQLSFYLNDLYDLSAVRAPAEQLIRIEQSLGAASVLLALLYFIQPQLLVGRGVYFISVVLSGIFVGLSRVLIDRAWNFARPPMRVLIIGSGELACDVARELRLRPDLGMEVVGFAGAKGASNMGDLFGRPLLGRVDAVDAIVRSHAIDRIMVATEDDTADLPIRELVRLRLRGVRTDEAHKVLTALTGRVWLRSVDARWFVFSEGFTSKRLMTVLKRVMDLILATFGFIVSVPVITLVAVAIWLEDKGPILYRQVRVGKAGKHFELLKLRSMSAGAETDGAPQWCTAGDPRVTRVGAFIRKYRLDELPQFINIIRGDMSFVGPRPERPYFVEQLREIIPYYDERSSVRPGLTGWAQIRYGYGASVEDARRKLEYDLFYLKNLSLVFDCAIIFDTIRIVLAGEKSR
jgi:sugar transferase (PEP-CTERM system associated)